MPDAQQLHLYVPKQHDDLPRAPPVDSAIGLRPALPQLDEVEKRLERRIAGMCAQIWEKFAQVDEQLGSLQSEALRVGTTLAAMHAKPGSIPAPDPPLRTADPRGGLQQPRDDDDRIACMSRELECAQARTSKLQGECDEHFAELRGRLCELQRDIAQQCGQCNQKAGRLEEVLQQEHMRGERIAMAQREAALEMQQLKDAFDRKLARLAEEREGAGARRAEPEVDDAPLTDVPLTETVLCKSRHALELGPTPYDVDCDDCGKEFNPGSMMWRCITCEYDLCDACHAKRAASAEPCSSMPLAEDDGAMSPGKKTM